MYVRPDRGSTDIIKSEFQGILPCSGITGIDILVNPIHFSDAESIFKDKPVTFIAYAFTPKGLVKYMSVKFSKSECRFNYSNYENIADIYAVC